MLGVAFLLLFLATIVQRAIWGKLAVTTYRMFRAPSNTVAVAAANSRDLLVLFRHMSNRLLLIATGLNHGRAEMQVLHLQQGYVFADGR